MMQSREEAGRGPTNRREPVDRRASTVSNASSTHSRLENGFKQINLKSNIINFHMSWARASYLSLISVKFLKASYAKSVKDYSDSNRTWSVLDARVCLPAVLNDPRNPIRNSEPLPTPPPTFLPKVSRKNFDTYLAKLQKRVSPEELQAPYKNCQFFNIFLKKSIFS